MTRTQNAIGVLLCPSPAGPGMIKSPPLDVANLIAILKNDLKYNIKLFDLRINAINKKEEIGINIFNKFSDCFDHILTKEKIMLTYISRSILKKINFKGIEFMIFSVSVLEQLPLQYLVSSLCIAKELKNLAPEIKVVFFGHCPKDHARKIMDRFKFIDAFSEGGNELAVLDYINNCKTKKAIQGICYRDSEQLIISKTDRLLDLNHYPLPDFSLFNFKDYKCNDKLVLPYEVSRGCVNNCFFCYYIHKDKISYKNIDKVVKELNILSKKYNTNLFHFMDAEINFNEDYLERLCKEFKKGLPGIRWSALAIPNLNQSLLKKMRESGCAQLRWGVEYGSDRMLKLMNKNTNVETIKEVLKNSFDLGIYNHVTLLSGLKSERSDDVRQTNQFILDSQKYINAANECVFGKLGHFSIAELEKLLYKKRRDGKLFYYGQKYSSILKKCNIPAKDIIEALTNKLKITFLAVPSDSISLRKNKEERDERVPHFEISAAISYLNKYFVCDIKYFNFGLLFAKKRKISNYLKMYCLSREERSLGKKVNLMLKFIKDSDYFLFYIPWWCTNIKTSAGLAKAIKDIYPYSKIVFFGPCCRLYPKEILNKFSFIDFLIMSEPEEALSFIARRRIESVPNIAHRDNNNICIHKEIANDLEKSSHYLDYSIHYNFLEKYNLPCPPFLCYELSRGCKYNCFFCSCLTAKELRFKKIYFAVNELKNLIKNTNIAYLFFLDSLLNFNNDYLSEFLDAIIHSKVKIIWSAYMVAKNLDHHIIKKIKRAGCIHIRWGIESANVNKQRIISKKLDLQEASRILQVAHGEGIRNQPSFIAGLPYDCQMDNDLIIEFIEKNHNYMDCVNLYIFKPRRHTVISENSQAFGIKTLNTVDNFWHDEVPFDEIRGLPWRLKREQQFNYQYVIRQNIEQFKLPDVDPQLYFRDLIKNYK